MVSILILAGCGAPSTVRHQNSIRKGSHPYRTFAVLDHPVGRSDAFDARVVAAIREVMGTKGYAPADKEEADLLVSYKLLLSGERAPIAPLHGPERGGTMAMDPQGVVVGQDVLQADFVGAMNPNAPRQKVLLVTLQDASSYRVVWLGWAESEVTDATMEEQTNDALTRIMLGVPEVAL
ncbi:MAG: DUF4136 domain-containing protein [Myxococcales bacterium]|nr:DUF4136 domain-containing protein [Myxococcales bacterium]